MPVFVLQLFCLLYFDIKHVHFCGSAVTFVTFITFVTFCTGYRDLFTVFLIELVLTLLQLCLSYTP